MRIDAVEMIAQWPCYTAVLPFAQICQETGKEQEVEVLYDEGVANHIGPEPCGGLREETDEKLVGARVGGVSRRASASSSVPTPVGEWKATWTGALCRAAAWASVGSLARAGQMAVAPRAPPTQPTAPDDLEASRAPSESVASAPAHPPSLA